MSADEDMEVVLHMVKSAQTTMCSLQAGEWRVAGAGMPGNEGRAGPVSKKPRKMIMLPVR